VQEGVETQAKIASTAEELPGKAMPHNSARGVHWNEANLEQNESERTATMTIDEPPTPFNFEYCQDDDEDEGDKIVDAAPAAPADARPSISFADQWDKAGLTETLQNSANLVPAVQQYEISEEERAEARRKFDENRKKHYNMRAVLQAHDDDEGEEGVEASKDVDDVGVPLKRKSSDGAEAKEGV